MTNDPSKQPLLHPGASDTADTANIRRRDDVSQHSAIMEDFRSLSLRAPMEALLDLPSTESPSFFIRSQQVSNLECALDTLKARRLKEHDQPVYIPPMAKANLQAKDDDLFPLMNNIRDFLDSDRRVMLIMGDSGAGKSTFNLHLEHLLWTNYNNGNPIPLFVNLPTLNQPDLDMVIKQLQMYNFKDDQIQEMKQNRQLILICDGYDESQLSTNLHTTNRLNQHDEWRAKMIISCRTQFLGPVYKDRFVPRPTDRYKAARLDLFQEVVIAPFSKEQVEDYVARYVPLEPRPWVTEDYMRMLTTIPNLMDLVKNPFLLTLTLEALPGVTRSQQDLSTIILTRVQLYDHFSNEWLDVNMRRLRDNTLTHDERDILEHMVEKGFTPLGVNYSKKLAQAIFDKHDGNPVVKYIHLDHKDTWKADFFGPQPDVRFLRESSPLTRTGSLFRFIHRSMLEYFFSRAIFDPCNSTDHNEFAPQQDSDSSIIQSLDSTGPLFKRNLVEEPSIIQFLSDRVKLNLSFGQQLLCIIDQSKTDASAAIAAANAITILVRAGIQFNGVDLRNVKISGADISGGQFDCGQFQGANLRGVNFAKCWLREANFSGAQMEDVRFGELAYLNTTSGVRACTYSPDGNFLALVLEDGSVSIYEVANWSTLHVFSLATQVLCIAFSPDSRQILTGSTDGRARLWDCRSGKVLSIMLGHTQDLRSVAFSPCGKRFSSASSHTARIWGAEDGRVLLVLRGHTKRVVAVKYSPDGQQLASGSWDGTIRFWDPQTGELGAVWVAPLGAVLCLTYSPDGLWIGTGHGDGDTQLWNVVSGEPGSVLRGHASAITGVAFSPSGLFVVSSSEDSTARLWDVLTSTSISVLSGHSGGCMDASFSPDGLLIASGGSDHVVRLWDVKIRGVALDMEDIAGNIVAMRYISDGRHILTVNKNKVLAQWDIMRDTSNGRHILTNNKNKVLSPWDTVRDNLETNSFSSVSSALASARAKRDRVEVITRCDNQIGAARFHLSGYGGPAYHLATSPCGRWVVCKSLNNTVLFWDTHATQPHHLVTLLLDPTTIYQVTFSSDGPLLATCCARNVIRIFTSRIGQQIKVARLKNGRAQILAYSPRGEQLAIGTSAGLIYLWNSSLEKPQESMSLFAGTREVTCISYSPCGQWIVAGSGDGTIRLWRFVGLSVVECRFCLYVVEGLSMRVDIIVWNPQIPHEFATRSADHSIHVWRVLQSEKVVRIELIWGSNIGQLLVTRVAFEDAIGLSEINSDLLRQRGGVHFRLLSDHYEEDHEEEGGSREKGEIEEYFRDIKEEIWTVRGDSSVGSDSSDEERGGGDFN